jgi:hypothetical protein
LLRKLVDGPIAGGPLMKLKKGDTVMVISGKDAGV